MIQDGGRMGKIYNISFDGGETIQQRDALPSGRFVYHDKANLWIYRGEPLGTSHVGADGMDPLYNHADGKIYDSKSAYIKAVKSAGCEIIGNEQIRNKKKPFQGGKDLDVAIKKAMDMRGI